MAGKRIGVRIASSPALFKNHLRQRQLEQRRDRPFEKIVRGASPGLLLAIRRAIPILALSVSSNVLAQSSTQVHTITIPQIRDVEDSKAGRSETEKKLSSQLLDTLKQRASGSIVSTAPKLQADTLTAAPEGVVVDIDAPVTPDLLEAINGLNGHVINSSERFQSIRASIPLEALTTLAGRPEIRSIAPAAKAQANVIDIAGEGVIAHTADLAAQLGLTGRGVRIGVLSDSIDNDDHSAESKGTIRFLGGQKIHVVTDEDGAGEGEGLAMLEIIHAIAPDAELYFATGLGGNAHMAENIIKLQREGCDIIVDDLTYFNEAPFQDDAISRAVNEVSDAGVLYFSSARNSGNQLHNTSGTWEGDFKDGGPAGPAFGAAGANARLLDFGGGITLNTVDDASFGGRVDLFWSDPLVGSTNGYDLFVVNSRGEVVGSSTTSRTGGQPPYQAIGSVRSGQSIVIVKEAAAAPRFLHLDTGRSRLRHSTAGNVRGHNAAGAANAFSIGAMSVPSPAAAFRQDSRNSIEVFSSDGPRRIFYDKLGREITPGNLSSTGGQLRSKPDLTGADNVTTTLPSDSGLNPFRGTSAAAPHVAAIAALLMSCTPRPTPTQIRHALETTAIPLEGDQPNITAGFGIVMARRAVADACAVASSTP